MSVLLLYAHTVTLSEGKASGDSFDDLLPPSPLRRRLFVPLLIFVVVVFKIQKAVISFQNDMLYTAPCNLATV